ncbi:MAG TPA: flagellar hook-associated protein FlgL, partial [Bacilli bacterium]|nr:flagellar hook-associated protein FlgL [Bacilli bacterium]
MRVTQGMLNSNMLNYLNANNTRMSKYQEMLASGQKLNRPSDDPVAVGYAMRYTEQISRNDQYQRNIDAAMSNLDFLDTSLNQVNEVLKRARELAVRATTESMSIESRQAVAKEIHQLHDQLVGIGNTQFNGQYIFNGQKTDVQPYNPNDTNAMYDAADPGQIHYAVSDGITIPVNVSGERLFGSKVTPGNEATSDNVFAIMAQLEQDLLADNQAGISASLDKLDSRTSKVLDTWAEIGARGNR